MKRLVLALMAICMIVLVANADPPPAWTNPSTGQHWNAGWGKDPENWSDATGSASYWGLYDPSMGGGDWHIFSYNSGTGEWTDMGQIVYQNINLDLWIEMLVIQTYQFTDYRWHYATLLNPGPTPVDFYISGTVSSNQMTSLSLTYVGQDINKLHGHCASWGGAPADLNLTWKARMGTGLIVGQGQTNPSSGYQLVTVPAAGDMVLPWYIPPCDHWFEFWGHFDLIYHGQHGHWDLTMGGCPLPVL